MVIKFRNGSYIKVILGETNAIRSQRIKEKYYGSSRILDVLWDYGYNISEKGNDMRVQDLEDGMVCQLRNGSTYIVLKDMLRKLNGNTRLDEYDENNLTHHNFEDYDIITVFTTFGRTIRQMLDLSYMERLVWCRKEPIELTMEELEKVLGFPVKIVKE